MTVQTRTTAGVIKSIIRDTRTERQPAREGVVKESLREQCKDYETACEVYERLRKQGEIYSYEKDGKRIVKVTEDSL